MIKEIRYPVISLFLSVLIIFSCKSAPERPRDAAGFPSARDNRQLSGGLADEIRSLIETGRLSSMNQALEIIRSRELSDVDFGRVMNGVCTLLIRLVYPDAATRLPVIDLPQTHNYTRIIREAEKGNYLSPPENSSDFFEYILPFLAVNSEASSGNLGNVLSDLEKAGELRPFSIFPPFLQGLFYERTGKYEQAQAAYRRAFEISNECYPAQAGIARVMRLSGNKEAAAALFSDLVINYPDSLDVKRQLAVTYYENSDWSRAGPAVDEILQHEPRDGEFLLMKAHILIEQGNFSQAQAPLDAYSSINSNNRKYLFLRARLQAEGNRNRDSALNYLRSIIRTNGNDEEALIYAVRLLMESQRPADQTEGRELLERLQQVSGSSLAVLSLSLRDAVQSENWRSAQGFLTRILVVRRTPQDLIDAYYAERGLGNNARGLSYARELYETDASNIEYAVIYISALIDNGRRDEASRMLEARLAASAGAAVKSMLYYQRSRIQNDEETALGDLRSSLFEDPRNLEALIAMFERYHRRREERRAVYYLRQALALFPDNPRVKRYEKEYAALLNRN